MNKATITSDYAPDTKLVILRCDGGDIGLKIIGNGNMRIAASGGKMRGWRLVSVVKSFRHIMKLINGDKSCSKRWVDFPEEKRYELYLNGNTPTAIMYEVEVFNSIRYTFSVALTGQLMKSEQYLPANSVIEAKRVLEKQLADMYELLFQRSEDDMMRYQQCLTSLNADDTSQEE